MYLCTCGSGMNNLQRGSSDYYIGVSSGARRQAARFVIGVPVLVPLMGALVSDGCVDVGVLVLSA